MDTTNRPITASADGVDIILSMEGGAELWCRKARRVCDAQGAICFECQMVFDVTTCPYWDWTKSKAMHFRGTGHKAVMFTILRGVPASMALLPRLAA